MLKKIVFLCVVMLVGVVLASCTGNKNIANPFPYGDESAMIPADIWHDIAYVPVDLYPYLPWDLVPYLPWDYYPYLVVDDLHYLPHDFEPYFPSDEIPYFNNGFELPTVGWTFLHFACSPWDKVVMIFQAKPNYLFNPHHGPDISAHDCQRDYSCYPVEGGGVHGQIYCMDDNTAFSSKNCPFEICVDLPGGEQCETVAIKGSVDCVLENKENVTPEPQPTSCSAFTEKECLAHYDECTWVPGTVALGYCKNK